MQLKLSRFVQYNTVNFMQICRLDNRLDKTDKTEERQGCASLHMLAVIVNARRRVACK
jgi:hypothetical protein